MLKIEARKLYRSNGLIDDFVLYGCPADYKDFAEKVTSAIDSGKPIQISTQSHICLEIHLEERQQELFTSFQNQDNMYFSSEDWEGRNLLRLKGNKNVLTALAAFLENLSGLGLGYSYLSEYSESHEYSFYSPEWRLHVDHT